MVRMIRQARPADFPLENNSESGLLSVIKKMCRNLSYDTFFCLQIRVIWNSFSIWKNVNPKRTETYLSHVSQFDNEITDAKI